MVEKNNCPICGGMLIQKNRMKLFLAGIILLAIGTVLIFVNPNLWIFSVLPGIISIYLIAWSSVGKGLWCRQCKNFPLNISKQN